MASRNRHQVPIQTPELMLSDSEDSYYSSEDEMSERDQTNHLLRQAHHYVITEGGKDSPATYMERIQRIDRSLLREIVKYSYECDSKLYRAVRQKVDHVQREFEDAVDAESSVCTYEEMPEYYTAAAEEVLYRKESSPLIAKASSVRHKTKPTTKDELERTYLYGGPGNDAEQWYKNYPTSLPFPETIRMADWESLRIHYDLATTGSLDSKEPVISIGVSFKDPLLAHHDNLARYESGSRFKLPVVQPSDVAKVNEINTPEKLYETINAFNQGDSTTDKNGEYNYAPRVFLDKLEVNRQIDRAKHIDPATVVDDVRCAVNKTPTRPHPSHCGDGYAPSVTHEPFNKQRSAPTSSPENVIIPHPIRVDKGNNFLGASRVPRSNEPRPQTINPEPSSRVGCAKSPAIRRIKAATEAAIRSSPQPQSPPAQFEATRVLIPMKRPYGHPCKNLVPGATIPKCRSTAGGTKRKRLSKDASYKPLADDAEDEEEVDEAEEPPAKQKRTAAMYEKHTSVRELKLEGTKSSTPTTVEGPKTPALTPDLTPALTPASGSSMASTPPAGKARAAGKQKRKIRTKRDFEERVSPEKYRELMGSRHTPLPAEGHESVTRGSTRSGKLRAV
ncbi:uncharacterized protein EKO05_0004121 [Ascochyta rabiei]|uniref:DNA binding n=1 Tax=Didymella rabiei TaxID=5454 RepID=A0A162Y7B8_DIDRA|nr:uncharacterized protein EKO05_0004121 [Ascochyta rabiei]KZM19856.1 DNA binding [Ascochyta rabiei]UPX13620.1 hypothetical protein EKO05_0004121 [Ascochyta rabiei]